MTPKKFKPGDKVGIINPNGLKAFTFNDLRGVITV